LAQKKFALDRSRKLVDVLKNQTIEGRVVIQIDDPEKMKDSSSDIELENGDKLVIPAIPKIVNVVGEVYSQSALFYSDRLNVTDYINRLGGFNKNADKGNVYVLRANGSVVSKDQGYGVMSMKLTPGDTIIVPQEVSHYDFFNSVGDFTKWFYEAAVAYAIIHAALK